MISSNENKNHQRILYSNKIDGKKLLGGWLCQERGERTKFRSSQSCDRDRDRPLAAFHLY